MIRLWKNSQCVVLVATSCECPLPGIFVLSSDDVVVQFPEEREHRRPQLTQRRRGIIEIQAPNKLPLGMIRRSGERFGRRPHASGKLLAGRSVLLPSLAGSSKLVL